MNMTDRLVVFILLTIGSFAATIFSAYNGSITSTLFSALTLGFLIHGLFLEIVS